MALFFMKPAPCRRFAVRIPQYRPQMSPGEKGKLPQAKYDHRGNPDVMRLFREKIKIMQGIANGHRSSGEPFCVGYYLEDIMQKDSEVLDYLKCIPV